MSEDVVELPSARDIRRRLILRVEGFCAATQMAPTMVCRRAMNDSAFFSKLKDGGNFTLETYQRLLDYLNANQPNHHPRKRKNHNGEKNA